MNQWAKDQKWEIIDIGEEKDFIAIEFNGSYIGWLATKRKVYQLMDSRFKEYAQKHKRKFTIAI